MTNEIPFAQPEHADVRELRKWLNEDPSRPIDRAALARVLAPKQTVAWLYQWVDDGVIYSDITGSKNEAFAAGHIGQRALCFSESPAPEGGPQAGSQWNDDRMVELKMLRQWVAMQLYELSRLKGPNGKGAPAPQAALPEPFHPDASHVSADYRDGWNACYRAALAAQPASSGVLAVQAPAKADLTTVQVSTRRPEDYTLINGSDGTRWVIRNGGVAHSAADQGDQGMTNYHIKQLYTLYELRSKIASNEFCPELLLQHAMLLLDRQAPAEGDTVPCGWFEGPHGAFRANPAYRMDWPPQPLQWQVPVYLRLQPQPKLPPARDMDAATTDAAIHYTAGWNACREAIAQATAPGATAQAEQAPAVGASWTPTAENINALTANCDPAGTVADNTVKADLIRELQASNRRIRDELGTPGNRWPEARYAGYTGQPYDNDYTADQAAAFDEGQRARVGASKPPVQQGAR